MEDLKIFELYKLLYYMKSKNTVQQLSEEMFWSISKTSKKIKYYEDKLNTKLIDKSGNNLISERAEKLLVEISKPYFELVTILNQEKIIGIDDNLIDDINSNDDVEYLFSSSKELIDKFNLRLLGYIIVSEDYDKEIAYSKKTFYCRKDVYLIKNKNNSSNILYANDTSCPIRKRLDLDNIKVDVTLNQSIGICKMVNADKGYGYTFSLLAIDKDNVESEYQFSIDFYKYS